MDIEQICVGGARPDIKRERLQNEMKGRKLYQEKSIAVREMEYGKRKKDREASNKLDVEKYKLSVEIMAKNS